MILILRQFENTKPVYEGKQLMINFYSGLEWVGKVKFTTPRGDPLFNVNTIIHKAREEYVFRDKNPLN